MFAKIHNDTKIHNERLNAKTEGSKHLTYTGCVGRDNSKSSSWSRGHVGGTRSGQVRKKPKDLSAREREERGRGKGDPGRGSVCCVHS